MSKHLKITNRLGEELIFEDFLEGFEVGAEKHVTKVELCCECHDRFNNNFNLMTERKPFGYGACEVAGCCAEADYVAYFTADNPVEVVNLPPTILPAVEKQFCYNAADLARYLYDHVEFGKITSFYEFDHEVDEAPRYINEHLVTKIALADTDYIIMNARNGGNIHMYRLDECASRAEFVDDMESFIYGNSEFNAKDFAVSKTPFLFPGFEDDMKDDEKKMALWQKNFIAHDAIAEPLPIEMFAEYVASLMAKRSPLGEYIDFYKDEDSYNHYRVSAIKIGKVGGFYVCAGDGFDFNFDPAYDENGFVDAFIAFLHEQDFEDQVCVYGKDHAEKAKALYEASHAGKFDAQRMTEYIDQNFGISIEALRLINNILTYAVNNFRNDNDARWRFVRKMVDGTGINLSDEEIKRLGA